MSNFVAADFYELDDLLSPSDKQIRNKVRTWVSERFMPLIQKHNRAGTFPMELAREMGALHCFGATIKGYGCAGLSSLAYGLIMQELERGDTGLRTFASVQGALAMNAINMFGSESQKQLWLPSLASGEKLSCFALTESNFGSNPGGMETSARKTSSGFVLNGEKMWIGNGIHADTVVVWAKVDGEAGVDPKSSSAIRGFLVPKGAKGFRAEIIQGKLSMRAADTCRLHFENCELDADAILPLSKGLRSPLQCLNHARYGIAFGVVGSAMACFDEAKQYALKRNQFGKPIASFQLVQRKLATMLTELTKAQLVCLRLAQLKDAGKATPAQISLAKRDNINMAIDVARNARDILGGVGILDDNQCFRHMCNLESVKTYEGTEDMHLLILGEQITGIAAFT